MAEGRDGGVSYTLQEVEPFNTDYGKHSPSDL